MLEKIQKYTYKHGKLISFAVSTLLVLFMDAIKIITFDSVMPYLVGIGLWAVIWNVLDDNNHTHYRIHTLLLAILISVLVSLNLCIEHFLQFPFTVTSFMKFIVVCGVICISIISFSFKLPSEKNFRTVHIIGSILFGIFSCAGNYVVLESITSPMNHPVRFLLLCLLSFCSWTILFSGALNAFHSVSERICAFGGGAVQSSKISSYFGVVPFLYCLYDLLSAIFADILSGRYRI